MDLTFSLTVAEHQQIQERLFIIEQTLESLRDKFDVPKIAGLIDANFYRYFPKMLLLKDEVQQFRKYQDALHVKLEDVEQQNEAILKEHDVLKKNLQQTVKQMQDSIKAQEAQKPPEQKPTEANAGQAEAKQEPNQETKPEAKPEPKVEAKGPIKVEEAKGGIKNEQNTMLYRLHNEVASLNGRMAKSHQEFYDYVNLRLNEYVRLQQFHVL